MVSGGQAPSPSSKPTLIGLDWGTTSLRAFLMAEGRVIDERRCDDGVQALAGQAQISFERALRAVTADWREAHGRLPIVACGMVGSAQGWREVPYVNTPADAQALAAGASVITVRDGTRLRIAPGVRHAPPGGTPDVMRGEEVQVFGALARGAVAADAGRCVLPGTHSKWVDVRAGRITALSTFMTGEVYALLRRHSILGRLMADAQEPPAGDVSARSSNDAAPSAFARGLDAGRGARYGELLNRLFAVRALGLHGLLSPEEAPDYLSGLLIGAELSAALHRGDAADAPIALIGEPTLCARYAQALAYFGKTHVVQIGNTAPDGLWALARAAGDD